MKRRYIEGISEPTHSAFDRLHARIVERLKREQQKRARQCGNCRYRIPAPQPNGDIPHVCASRHSPYFSTKILDTQYCQRFERTKNATP
jgi:hypothetical protein